MYAKNYSLHMRHTMYTRIFRNICTLLYILLTGEEYFYEEI